jgi:hypothetical protein
METRRRGARGRRGAQCRGVPWEGGASGRAAARPQRAAMRPPTSCWVDSGQTGTKGDVAQAPLPLNDLLFARSFVAFSDNCASWAWARVARRVPSPPRRRQRLSPISSAQAHASMGGEAAGERIMSCLRNESMREDKDCARSIGRKQRADKHGAGFFCLCGDALWRWVNCPILARASDALIVAFPF